MEPVDHCPACDSDWWASSYGLDVFTGDADCFVAWSPCCDWAAELVGASGFETLTGRPLVVVLGELTGLEVLEVSDFDSLLVCRLRVVDPTVSHGKKASSPKGWQASLFQAVDRHHRHHKAPQGWKFGVAVFNGRVRVGVATVGRPVSRVLDDGDRLEVTRVCTFGPSALRFNAASKLYAAAGKRARAMGYQLLLTYTLDGIESGHSLQASGWTVTRRTDGGSWSCDSRPRIDKAPTSPKVRWERGLTKRARRQLGA